MGQCIGRRRGDGAARLTRAGIRAPPGIQVRDIQREGVGFVGCQRIHPARALQRDGRQEAAAAVLQATADVGIRVGVVLQDGLDQWRHRDTGAQDARIGVVENAALLQVLHDQGRCAGNHRRRAGRAAESGLAAAGADLGRDARAWGRNVGLDRAVRDPRAAGRARDDVIFQGDEVVRADAGRLAEHRLQAVPIILGDAERRCSDCAAAVAEGGRGVGEAVVGDQHGHGARRAAVGALDADGTHAAVHQEDLTRQRTGGEGGATVQVGARAVTVLQRTCDVRRNGRAPGLEHTRGRHAAGIDQVELLGRHAALCDADGAGCGRGRANDVRLVRAVAGGDDDDGAVVAGDIRKVGQIVFRLAVERAERHVDDVRRIEGRAVLIVARIARAPVRIIEVQRVVDRQQ